MTGGSAHSLLTFEIGKRGLANAAGSRTLGKLVIERLSLLGRALSMQAASLSG